MHVFLARAGTLFRAWSTEQHVGHSRTTVSVSQCMSNAATRFVSHNHHLANLALELEGSYGKSWVCEGNIAAYSLIQGCKGMIRYSYFKFYYLWTVLGAGCEVRHPICSYSALNVE